MASKKKLLSKKSFSGEGIKKKKLLSKKSFSGEGINTHTFSKNARKKKTTRK